MTDGINRRVFAAGLAVAGAAVLAACDAGEKKTDSTSATPPASPAEPEVKFIDRDGVKLAYVEAGSGEPSILLVHGMLGSHSGMMSLFHHLSKNHRVVAVDLRGHGQSDAPVSVYDDTAFNGDLMFMCDTLGLKKPVAMGHSFGGSTLLHLAYDHPDFLGRELVLLDSGVRSAAARAAELKAVYDDPDPQALSKFLAGRMRSPYDPPPQPPAPGAPPRKQPPEHVVESMQKTVLDFNAADAAAAVKLPALFILATRHFSDPETLARLGPNWLLAQVVASGHSIQNIVPAQVFAMVDRFLEIMPLVPRT